MHFSFYYTPKSKFDNQFIQEKKNAIRTKYELKKLISHNVLRTFYLKILERFEIFQISTYQMLYTAKYK